jgi:predicted deacylase
MKMAGQAFTIGGIEVAPGERRLVNLPLSALSNRTPMAVPVSVIRGRREGPTLFVSAAIHGDELTASRSAGGCSLPRR